MKKLLEDNSETIDSQNQELIKLTSMIQKMVRLTNVFYFFFVFFHNKLLLFNLCTNFIENNLIFFTFLSLESSGCDGDPTTE